MWVLRFALNINAVNHFAIPFKKELFTERFITNMLILTEMTDLSLVDCYNH